MEWSRPIQQGELPTARSGHASVTVGENWFIVGGGDNKSGMQEFSIYLGFVFVGGPCICFDDLDFQVLVLAMKKFKDCF